MSGDDEDHIKIVVLFLTTTSDPKYLARKIGRLRQKGIKVYVISLMPEESQEFRLVEESESAGIKTYPFDPKQVVGELRMLFQLVEL